MYPLPTYQLPIKYLSSTYHVPINYLSIKSLFWNCIGGIWTSLNQSEPNLYHSGLWVILSLFQSSSFWNRWIGPYKCEQALLGRCGYLPEAYECRKCCSVFSNLSHPSSDSETEKRYYTMHIISEKFWENSIFKAQSSVCNAIFITRIKFYYKECIVEGTFSAVSKSLFM